MLLVEKNLINISSQNFFLMGELYFKLIVHTISNPIWGYINIDCKCLRTDSLVQVLITQLDSRPNIGRLKPKRNYQLHPVPQNAKDYHLQIIDLIGNINVEIAKAKTKVATAYF